MSAEAEAAVQAAVKPPKAEAPKASVGSEVRVNASLKEVLNNDVNSLLFGIDKRRLPLFRGLTSSGGALALMMLLSKGLFTLPMLATPAGLPFLGIALGAGAVGAGMSYLLEKRHKAFAGTVPSPEGDKKVKMGLFEWINNGVGKFVFGKNHEREPIIKAAAVGAGLLTGAGLVPGVGPLIAGVGAAVTGIGSSLFDVRRSSTQMPAA